MKTLAKFMTGAAAAALVSISVATPAQARHDRYDRYYRGHNRGSIVGDLITGIAVAGGIAAVTSALSRDGYRYGSRDRYRYRDGYRDAVNSCAYEAERYGRGRVRITDVDRSGYDGYRVRGVIEGGYDAYDRGYDRRWDRGDYGRYDYDRGDRDSFTCTTYGSGRIADFRLSDRSRW